MKNIKLILLGFVVFVLGMGFVYYLASTKISTNKIRLSDAGRHFMVSEDNLSNVNEENIDAKPERTIEKQDVQKDPRRLLLDRINELNKADFIDNAAIIEAQERIAARAEQRAKLAAEIENIDTAG